LDLVELAIEVEKSFGITIVNEDASKIITVGQLYDYVLAKLPAQETRRCLSAGAFYEFRRALIARFAVKTRRNSSFDSHRKYYRRAEKDVGLGASCTTPRLALASPRSTCLYEDCAVGHSAGLDGGNDCRLGTDDRVLIEGLSAGGRVYSLWEHIALSRRASIHHAVRDSILPRVSDCKGSGPGGPGIELRETQRTRAGMES
jgi:hypothetical protein